MSLCTQMHGVVLRHGHLGSMTLLVTLLLLGSTPAGAFNQDKELEARLKRNDPQALALFPAKGFPDGVAGLFRNNELVVVPGSERAWCQDQKRGALGPGCYVELMINRKGMNSSARDGKLCGLPARWYRSRGAKAYSPTPGSAFGILIAKGNWDVVDRTFDQPEISSNLTHAHWADECSLPFGK